MYIIYNINYVIQRDISTHKLRISIKITIVTTQDSNICITIEIGVCVCNLYIFRQYNSICYSKQYHLNFNDN